MKEENIPLTQKNLSNKSFCEVFANKVDGVLGEWMIDTFLPTSQKKRKKTLQVFHHFLQKEVSFSSLKNHRERKYSDISDHTVKLTRKSCCAAMHQSKLPQVMNNNGRKECNFASTVAAAVTHLWPWFIENLVKEMDHRCCSWQLPK